jgi:hypothetical protein
MPSEIVHNGMFTDIKLTNMIMQNLDCENKEIFITNFQLYLMFSNNSNEFVVDLYNIWEWLGFARKYIAKRIS